MLTVAEGQQLARDGYMVSQVLIVCTPSAVFEAATSGIQLLLPYYFMHAATDSATPVCSTTDQATVLLIAEYKSYMSGLFKFTLLGLSGEHTVYKKQVNIISSNIIDGRGRGKSCDRLLQSKHPRYGNQLPYVSMISIRINVNRDPQTTMTCLTLKCLVRL